MTLIEKIDVLKSLYDFSIELCQDDLIIRSIDSLLKQFVCYHIILIKMTNELKKRLKTIYNENSHWNKILAMIKEAFKINDEKSTQNKSSLHFVYRHDLIYYIFDDEKKRLCVPKSLKQKMFKLTHDQTHHEDFHKTYDRVASSIYIHQLIKRLRIYIAHCFECQFNQIKQHSTYNKLIFIVTSFISFYIIIMNWIIALPPTVENYNNLLTITCKFIKRILLIFEMNTWDAIK